jgi:sugar (pentulose or hexulose) kinase
MTEGVTIVVDIGKTRSKLSLWSRDGLCLHKRSRANQPQRSGSLSILDTAATADWLLATLSEFSSHKIEAIIPVAHGAAFAAIKGGSLAFAPIDYEQEIPEDVTAAYRAQRDVFSETGSPALPAGLNLGSQLHWLETLHGANFHDYIFMPYAQYWSWFLSGIATSEVTSLGCHSDLWSPAAQDYSPMAKRRGWAEQFAPISKAGNAIGTLKSAIAEHTGLPANVRVHCGLHDSNAAMCAAQGYAGIAGREATILSTGTWFIGMRSLSRSPSQLIDLATLPEDCDCLVNVDVNGNPVPSARFMGGREIETLLENDAQVDILADQPGLIDAAREVLQNGIMILPGFAPGFGPFAKARGHWVKRPEIVDQRRAAACLYAALVANRSLDLIGTKERILIEGRFAYAEIFVRALAALRPDTEIYTANADNDVSFGALRLLNPALAAAGQLSRVLPLDGDVMAYNDSWLSALGEVQ